MAISILRVLLFGVLIGVTIASTDGDDPDDAGANPQSGSASDGDRDGRRRGFKWWHRDGKPTGPSGPSQTERFVSADGYPGEVAATPGALLSGNPMAPAATPTGTTNEAQGVAASGGADFAGAPRSQNAAVVEGDIYRVLDNGTVLNLNRYRGLQVIDVSNPDAPAIVGGYSVQGNPEELYVQGDRAFVLLNNWRGYYGSPGEVTVERREGGLALAIDLSDPSEPQLQDSLFIQGQVRKSRMVTDGEAAALYVVSSFGEQRPIEGLSEPEEALGFGGYEWVEHTIVTSFDATGGAFVKRDEVDLGGYVQDIQATPNALLVATNDWTLDEEHSQVSIVDIGNAQGLMQLGDRVTVNGYIQSQFNMDLHEGVLRVVSTNWARDQTNMVETFDASDFGNVTPLDACTFGAGQDLYATLFVGNKAFFVTYLRIDPFHAFEIDDEGGCQERSEFVVSGWNDFFRAVANETRLIGIGTNDEDGGRTPAVSLYDITMLDSAEPLLARAQANQLEWSWSEANYDHRAFSVLEGAVSVQSEDGVEETGLVLLPFQGYTSETPEQAGTYVSGVQIFTFSDTSVTARAAMEHDTAVRRSFLASDEVTANLSEQALSLFDHRDPDAPQQLGSVDLAPDYGRVLAFGDYLARVRRPVQSYFFYDFESQADEANIPTAQIDIIAASGDPNTTDAVASFEVPIDARVLKAGDALAAITYRVTECEDWPCTYDTRVTLFDLSDPTAPVPAGSAQADDLSPSYVGFGGNPYYGGGNFIGCGVGPAWFSGNQVDGVFALGDSVVFTVAEQNRETLGIERTCSFRPLHYCESEEECETFYEGYRSCTSIDGGAETCLGEFYACSYSELESACEPVDLDTISYWQEDCRTYPRERYWTTYNFKALDVRDLENPQFGDLIEMPDTEESTRVLPRGQSLFYTYRNPATVADDPRPHVAYYYKALDFSDPTAPSVGGAVNIPGELIAVAGDQLYTRDLRWGEERAESYLHELTLVGDTAELGASHYFTDREVVEVLSDDDRLLVSHRAVFGGQPYPAPVLSIGAFPPGFAFPGQELDPDRLTIFSQQGLAPLGEFETDRWTTLAAANEGRVLYSVPGGMLLYNVEEPATPYAQAYFPVSGWPEQILFESGKITVTAGSYGIHRFDADAFNLLSE